MLSPSNLIESAAFSLARIPSVDSILGMDAVQPLIEEYGRNSVLAAVRATLQNLRAGSGQVLAETVTENLLAAALHTWLTAASQPRLKPVFNLTGTVLHTNLGRAMLPDTAVQAVVSAMTRPCNLEYDLDTGRRGERDSLVEPLLCTLTGAEAATVVNNNAAAVFLALNTLGLRKEVIVSRGELVEIGGAFRVPDIMSRAGCRLKEVGTTNRTHLQDYAEALTPRSALLLKVHTSNYAIQGFTAAVPERKLADFAHAQNLPFMVDLGSGTLLDFRQWGLPHEPTPGETLANGADLVTFSGDKLLGGPQAGIIVGRKELVAKIRKNPLKRALRVDKMTYAAMEAVLKLYQEPERLTTALPTLRLLTRPLADIEALARQILPACEAAMRGKAHVSAQACQSQIGSGSLPVDLLPSFCIAIAPLTQGKGEGTALKKIEQAFRALPVPVIGRITDGAFCLDLRCLEDVDTFVAQLKHLST